MEHVREHLTTCSLCAQELKTLENLNNKINQLEEVKPSPQFAVHFWRRVAERKQQESPSLWLSALKWSPRLKWGFSTALVVLFIFGIYIFWNGFQNPEDYKRVDFSPEIAEIEKEIDFYQNYDIIKEMDILVTFENNETSYNNGKFLKIALYNRPWT